MKPHLQFRRHAGSYDRYNLIQTRVARALAKKIGRPISRIVDLGCGSGGFFRAYEHPFTCYLAVDVAPEMVARHPRKSGVETMVGDFDDPELFRMLRQREFDLLVSASALQWSKDLDTALARIASLRKPVALALFTSGTFETLRRVAGTPSPIRSRAETTALLTRHLPDARIGFLRYRLYFRDTLAMLRYIKRSGVSGGIARLRYKETRRLLAEYPLRYLEFEVVTAVSRAIHA